MLTMKRARQRLFFAMSMALSMCLSSEAEEPIGGIPVRTALEKAGLTSGLIVHLGTVDGQLEADLVRQTGCPVLGMAPDRSSAEKARRYLAEKKLLGRATILDQIDPRRVPLVDESAAVLIADHDRTGEMAPTQAELLRAVRPLGTLFLRRNSKWHTIQKPLREGYDDWPLYFHDASGNDSSHDRAVGEVKGLQWAACDTGSNNKVGLRLSSGITVGVESVPGRRKPRDVLIARDAFSGILLWERHDIPVTNRYTLLLDRERLYCLADDTTGRGYASWMQALDLKTGKDLFTLKNGLDFSKRQVANARFRLWPQATLHNGILIQVLDNQLCALEAKTGKRLWSKTYPRGSYVYLPTIARGNVIVVHGDKWTRSGAYLKGWDCCELDAIIAYDLSTGKEQWQVKPPEGVMQMAVHHAVADQGRYVVASHWQGKGKRDGGKYLFCYDVANGRMIWQRQVAESGVRGHGTNWRVLIQGDKVWSTQLRTARPFRLADGKPINDKPYSFFIGWCQPVRATPNRLLAALFMMKSDEGEVLRCDASRSACDIGSFPAYGRIYGTATNCGCEAFLPGSNTFHSLSTGKEWKGNRLFKGLARAAPLVKEVGNSWPVYMHDSQRSNWTEAKIGPRLKKIWIAAFANPLASLPEGLRREWKDNPYFGDFLSAPTVAEGVAMVALPHEHAVVALDAKSGKEKWRKRVDGRVGSPPTIYKGMVLFGTRNGWIYAVNRDTGETIWRFLASPQQRQMMAYGQPESTWPSFGTVLIHNDLAWVTAGRSTQTDGGIYWYALRAATGEVAQSGILNGTGDWISQGKGKSQKTLQPKQPITSATPFTLTESGKQLLMWNSGVEVAGGKPLRGGIEIWPAGASNYYPEQPLPDAILPGQYGLVQSGVDGGGKYGRAAFYSGIRGKIIAYRGRDFVALCSNGGWGGRGGSPGPLERWQRRERVDRAQKKEAFAKKIWTSKDHPRSGRDNYADQQAMVKAGEQILVALGSRLLCYRYADGTKVGETMLPSAAVHQGIAVSASRVYVSCSNGSVVCFESE